VVRVSGYAAAAYCAGRGGLPPADAALPRPAGAPDLEFRDRGGAVVVLDPEAGVVPTTGRDSNVLTGFRCAR
jgi:hypothetical protein